MSSLRGRDEGLYGVLLRKCGSAEGAQLALEKAKVDLGIRSETAAPVLAAVALVSLGVSSEIVSKTLSWRDFESFCANVARVEGYEVQENIIIRKPRAQIDVIARSDSFLLTIDCKHSSRLGHSELRDVALAQLRRGRLLRRQLKSERRSIVSAILTLFDQGERFREGVALVPVKTLRDFLHSLEGITELMEPA